VSICRDSPRLQGLLAYDRHLAMIASASHMRPDLGGDDAGIHRRFAEAFDRARAADPDGTVEQAFAVGGRSVSSRIVGATLAGVFARAMLPSEAISPSGADLRLDLWDGAASGEPAPDPVPDGPYPDRRDAGERFMLTADAGHARLSSPDFEIHLDRAAAHAVGWIRSAASLSYWHRARPLRTLLTPWLADRGLTVLHAAMVAQGGRGIVLAAPSHSGKSTCAAACGGAGFDVLGDDTVAVENRAGAVLGHAVHAAVKLRLADIARHGELATRVGTAGLPWTDEAVAYVGELFPGGLVPSAPVAAIAFPRLGTAERTTFERVPRGRALRSLIGCILAVAPRDRATGFAALAEILETVPAYRVTVGERTAGIPSALTDLLAEAAG
jgi:hypothetical protein